MRKSSFAPTRFSSRAAVQSDDLADWFKAERELNG